MALTGASGQTCSSAPEIVLPEVFCHVTTGKDPLLEKLDGKDINSVAGVLKLYFRELKDPLFPFHMFDDLMACCGSCNFNSESSLEYTSLSLWILMAE